MVGEERPEPSACAGQPALGPLAAPLANRRAAQTFDADLDDRAVNFHAVFEAADAGDRDPVSAPFVAQFDGAAAIHGRFGPAPCRR